MVTEAAKELFALLNGLCAGIVFVILLAYLVRARPRRSAVVLVLLLIVLLCAFNAVVVYLLL
jgi:hypothetical protein